MTHPKNDIALPERLDPFQMMDRLDDEAIIAELEGMIIEDLVYHFKDGRQDIWGLAKAGVDEAVKQMAKKGEVIREASLEWEIDRERSEAFFKVLAGRYAVNSAGVEIRLDTAFGTKRQPMKYGTKQNPHWFEQGSMKAARNAKLRLVGAELKAKILALAKKTKRVRDVNPPPQDNDDPVLSKIQFNELKATAAKAGIENLRQFVADVQGVAPETIRFDAMRLSEAQEVVKGLEAVPTDE